MNMTPETFLADIPEEAARHAFAGVSWNPEGRGERCRAEYADQLAADYANMLTTAEKFGTLDLLPELFDRYHAGFKKRFLAHLASEARCVSWFIAGRSNFPAHRMNKRAEVAGRRLNEAMEFRSKAIAGINRKLRPASFISVSDADALEKLEIRIETLAAKQTHMREVNAAIRRTKKYGEEVQILTLQQHGLSAAIARLLLKPDFCGRIGYADFELTNNNANIRRLKARIPQVTAKRAAPAGEIEGTAATVELAPGENRVRLFFPGKPDADTITRLKRSGFRWAPSLGAWSAYHNANTVALAKQFAGA